MGGPLLTEGKVKVKSLLSENLQYHLDKNIPLFESVFRIGSDAHLNLIREARKMYSRDIIDLCEEDEHLIKTHLGEFGLFEGEEVPLDMPMVNESYDYDEVAQSEFGMDYDQLGPNEKEWVRDEIDNMKMRESLNEEENDRFAGSDPKAGSTIQGTGFDWKKKEKYYITRNLGRGQGMSLVKDKEFKSYEDAKEEADRLERSSKNMTAYFVSDKDMKRLKESELG